MFNSPRNSFQKLSKIWKFHLTQNVCFGPTNILKYYSLNFIFSILYLTQLRFHQLKTANMLYFTTNVVLHKIQTEREIKKL